MKLALIGLALISFLELLVWLPPLWRVRKVYASGLIVTQPVLVGLLIGNHFSLAALLILILSGYRVINLLRLVEGRTKADYLYRVSRRTSLVLIGLQLTVYGLAAGLQHLSLRPAFWLYLLLAGQTLSGLVILASTRRHLRTTRPPLTIANYASRDLPTLTVAIPARNETDDLEACLQSLVSSDYPKLEILVLDDCSQNKRTPEIIRAYAHSGVRFIAGQLPPEHWLAKNYAYQQLYEAASGDILLFCGVDTRFSATSLRLIVETMLSKHKAMLSLMPVNSLPSSLRLASMLVQPSRYAWELALPRRFLNRPPVLSTCWLITRAALEASGGFKAVVNSVSIESYFAKTVSKASDGYSFLQSGQQLGLSCAKTFNEQRATAIRTRYPQLHRRPELAAVLSLLELSVLVLPFCLLILALISQAWLIALLGLLPIALLTGSYAAIVNLTYNRFMAIGLMLLPLAALYDVMLLNYSLWQYEFRQVIWKGRNVCLPVMQVVPKLPRLN